MKFELLNKLPIIGVVLAIRDAILLLWSWISRNLTFLKIPFFFAFTVASIRAAVGTVGMMFTKLKQIQSTASSYGDSLASLGDGSASLLDKANAILPIGETLAFMAAYCAVLLGVTGYMVIRAAYKNIPGKAT